jgi:4-nitrophenyl phosphatase
MFDFATIRAVLLDMDGVLYRGKTVLPGVHDFLTFCEQQGIAYACITNNATRTREQYAQKLAALDIPISAERVFTSALITSHYLRETYPRGTTVYALGMDGLLDALFGDGYFVATEHKPELVVQGADFTLTYDKLKLGCLAIRAGARFIATNLDRTFPSEEGLVPGAGSLVAALQTATDTEPLVVGKPQPTMFRVALDMLQCAPEHALMIGDRLDTDIAGAKNAGLSGILVLTGVTTREELSASPHQPDAIFEQLPDLLAAWQRWIRQKAKPAGKQQSND